jgi:hypothetical protein
MTFNREEGVYEQDTERVKHEPKNAGDEPIITEEGVWQFDARGAISAVGEINKMMGYHAPEKYDHTTKGEKIDRVVVTIVRPKTDGKGA